jgi:hypothetical protein
MNDHVRNEIRRLKRERKDIDASIADFELMEGRLPAEHSPPEELATGKPAAPTPIDGRKPPGK